MSVVEEVKGDDLGNFEENESGVNMEVPVVSPTYSSTSFTHQDTSNVKLAEEGNHKKDSSVESLDERKNGVKCEDDSGSSHSSSSSSSGGLYENGEHFTLVGEVYLHGVMYGEMFKEDKVDEVVFKEVRVH